MKYNGCNSHIKPILVSLYMIKLSLKLSLHKFDFRNMKNIFKININLLYQLQKKDI